MGFAAARVSFKGAHVGQTAESIPDDYSAQSEPARQCCPSLQKGVNAFVLKPELMFCFVSLIAILLSFSLFSR